MSTAAALSIVVLLVALVYQTQHLFSSIAQPSTYTAQGSDSPSVTAGSAEWQQEMLLLGLATSTDPSAVPEETDPIAMIGPIVVAQLVGQYAGLVDSGKYDDKTGATVAESIAENVRAAISYKTHVSSDIKTDADTSYDRMIKYRADLREALSPLLLNTESELDLYAKYVETSDASYLLALSKAAVNYREAAKNAASLTIPRDALNYHLDILNAMELFAATLESMAKENQDAFASVALLRSYNTAEQRMFTSFDALRNYYGQKLP